MEIPIDDFTPKISTIGSDTDEVADLKLIVAQLQRQLSESAVYTSQLENSLEHRNLKYENLKDNSRTLLESEAQKNRLLEEMAQKLASKLSKSSRALIEAKEKGIEQYEIQIEKINQKFKQLKYELGQTRSESEELQHRLKESERLRRIDECKLKKFQELLRGDLWDH